MMLALADLLGAFEAVDETDSAETALAELRHQYFCVFASPADGNIEELVGGVWQPIEGGPQYIMGEVVHTGVNYFKPRSPQPFLEFHIPHHVPTRVYLAGIQDGFVYEEDGPLKILREALQGDDQDRLATVLAETGFRRI